MFTQSNIVHQDATAGATGPTRPSGDERPETHRRGRLAERAGAAASERRPADDREERRGRRFLQTRGRSCRPPAS